MVNKSLYRVFGRGHSSVKSSLLSSGNHWEPMDSYQPISEDTKQSWIHIRLEETQLAQGSLAAISTETNIMRISIRYVDEHFMQIATREGGFSIMTFCRYAARTVIWSLLNGTDGCRINMTKYQLLKAPHSMTLSSRSIMIGTIPTLLSSSTRPGCPTLMKEPWTTLSIGTTDMLVNGSQPPKERDDRSTNILSNQK